jgi:hypothetical protein
MDVGKNGKLDDEPGITSFSAYTERDESAKAAAHTACGCLFRQCMRESLGIS